MIPKPVPAEKLDKVLLYCPDEIRDKSIFDILEYFGIPGKGVVSFSPGNNGHEVLIYLKRGNYNGFRP